MLAAGGTSVMFIILKIIVGLRTRCPDTSFLVDLASKLKVSEQVEQHLHKPSDGKGNSSKPCIETERLRAEGVLRFRRERILRDIYGETLRLYGVP